MKDHEIEDACSKAAGIADSVIQHEGEKRDRFLEHFAKEIDQCLEHFGGKLFK